jgi:DNA modification methylase
VLPTLEKGSVDCVVTSPHYNQMGSIGEPSGSWADSHGGAGFVRSWRENGYDDTQPEDDYQTEQLHIFSVACRIASPTASLFYNHQCRWRHGEILHPVQWFRPEGWKLRQEIIWDRGGGMMSNAKMFCRFDERILWFDTGKHKWNQPSTGYGTIWRIARLQQQQGKLHPVQFPDDIPERCIEATTDIGDMACDPFMGSGTTGVACVRLGRRFIGIEKERKYFDIAVRRIEAELKRFPLFEAAPKIVQRGFLD